MCLKDFKEISFEKPKRVYKVLKVKNGWYSSPYSDFCWLRTGQVRRAYGILRTDDGVLGTGVFHSFKHVEDAIIEAHELLKYYPENTYIVAAFTIPVEGRTFEGIYGGNIENYASTHIIFEGPVKIPNGFKEQVQRSKYDRVWYYKSSDDINRRIGCIQACLNDTEEGTLSYEFYSDSLNRLKRYVELRKNFEDINNE